MLHALTSARLEFIVDDTSGSLEVVHLGSPVGRVDPTSFSAPIPEGGIDHLAPISVLAEAAAGWMGKPGLRLHRGGTVVFPRLDPATVTSDGSSLRAVARDPATQVLVTILATLHDAGVLELVVELRNDGAPLTVDEVLVSVPVPHASEILQFGGRWSDEFHPMRHSWEWGTFVVENRSGRTSATRFPMLMAGTAGFAEQSGAVTAIHLGWSGDGQVRADRLPDGRRILQAGEIFGAGEVVLDTGETHRSAPVFLAHSAAGLNGISDSFHGYVRARPTHVVTERPVILNAWEAVYFAHDLDTLSALADRAAAVGVERFVLDDGWFGARRNDRAGLGDWYVSRDVYPDGLRPLADHVRSLGMEFGLWFEPEMVNPDSDLYRAHPDWVLQVEDAEPIVSRHQLPLDLTRPEVSDYLFERITTLVQELDIAYIKWDMNRDIQHPGGADGRPVMHAQTAAVSTLINRIRGACPELAIETCSSGGARADYNMVERTGRVWTSDNNDARARHSIMRGAAYFLPLGVLGNHVGPKKCHITGRRFDMHFRAGTAMFGHMGMELDLARESEADREVLKRAIALHKQHRDLIHEGNYHRLETSDHIAGIAVVSADGHSAIAQLAVLDQHPAPHPPRLNFVGLDPAKRYQVALLWPEFVAQGAGSFAGSALMGYGLQLPQTHPDTCMIYHLEAET